MHTENTCVTDVINQNSAQNSIAARAKVGNTIYYDFTQPQNRIYKVTACVNEKASYILSSNLVDDKGNDILANSIVKRSPNSYPFCNSVSESAFELVFKGPLNIDDSQDNVQINVKFDIHQAQQS